jgi:malonyl-CoA decarboxylase
MVNCLYDPKRLDKHRATLSQGQIPMSAAVEDL